MRAGVYGDHSYSSSDLDEVVSNFDPSPAGKIPIHFGKSDQGGPIVGKVTALQRDGNTLSGQVSEVDPRLDQLFSAGKLSRRSFTVKRTPKGLALDRVGFHAPREFVNGTWRDGPATEADLTNLTQGGTSGHSGTATFGGDAQAVISFDELLLPVPRPGGRSMQGSDSEWRFQSNSEALSDLAKQRAREDKTLSFGEALAQVAEAHPGLTLPGTTINFDDDGPVPAGRCQVSQNSVELNRLATQYQHIERVSFAEALSAVVADNPELTR